MRGDFVTVAILHSATTSALRAGKRAIGRVVMVLTIGVGLLGFNSSAEEAVKLGVIEFNGKYGYIDAQGVMVIEPKFDEAYPFAANGLARIREYDPPRRVDDATAIALSVERAHNSVVNTPALIVALPQPEGKFGYINAKGEIVIAPRFWKADDFAANGLARVEYGGGYINAQGETVIAPVSPRVRGAFNFSDNGLALFETFVDGGQKYGYINTEGEIAIEPRFDGAYPFAANGLAVFKKFVKGNWKHGYINAKGETYIEKCGYINAKGEVVIEPRFEEADDFGANGLAPIKENGKYGFINTKGEIAIAPTFERVGGFAAHDLSLVQIDGKYGYINTKGEIVIPPNFKFAWSFAVNGLAVVMLGEKMGYINAKGEMVIAPRFDVAESFYYAHGLALVRIDGKYGYINAKGDIVIAPRFAMVSPFAANGVAQVFENAKPIYINTKGETVAYEDRVCGVAVLKNGQGKITWPPKLPKTCEGKLQ